MVGNVDEWVADWSDRALHCTDWTSAAGIPGGDNSCFGGPGTTGQPGETDNSLSIPGALFRGGYFGFGTFAGVFAVDSRLAPLSTGAIGFRYAR
jgi:hypothetical protein